MKLSELRFTDIGQLTERELNQAYGTLKRSFARSAKTFDTKGYRPGLLKRTREELSEASHIRDAFQRRQRETAIMRDYFYHTVPGDREPTRTQTSTVKGYREYLKHTGRVLGIANYATNEWTEDQRSDLWEMIDIVQELAHQQGGENLFQRGTAGNVLYQSGTNFRQIAIMVGRLDMTDPNEILRKLRERVEVMQINQSMTDEEFYGLRED